MAKNMDAVVAEVVGEAMSRPLPVPTPRRTRLAAVPGKIDVVVGMRRSGKTWLLFQHAHELAAAGVPRDRVLYLNFEDERLMPLQAEDLRLVPDAYFRRHPENVAAECHFLFDEIQNVPGWERFLRRLLDRGGLRIAVTGSSAKLLGKEIATALRGRSLSTELLPFSFAESLAHEGIALPERWPPGEAERALLSNRLRTYLDRGGFPEVQRVDDPTRRRILVDYVDVVLFRDVVERHGVTNLTALRWLVRRLLSQPAGLFTAHRTWNDLHAQGLAVAKDTVLDMMGWLEDAFMVLPVGAWAPSERARAVRPRKVQLIDPGLANAFSLRAGQDRGHLLENVVYLELRRRGWACSWVGTRSGFEVDFLAERHGERRLVQVCFEASVDPTRERELRALGEAMTEHAVEDALVVTLEEGRTERVGKVTVPLVPAWRWLLEPER